MSNGMIVRNPYEMKEFAKHINDYCCEMKRVCNQLKGALADAASGMRDDNSKKVRKRVEGVVDELLRELPVFEATSDTLKISAGHLDNAIEVMEGLCHG